MIGQITTIHSHGNSDSETKQTILTIINCVLI